MKKNKQLKDEVRIPKAGDVLAFKDERVRAQRELGKVLRVTAPDTQVAICFIPHSSLRPQVLGD